MPSEHDVANGRLLGLDLLRVASILPVLIGHLVISGQLRGGTGISFLERFSRGHYGVCLFFVVSGFIITRTILQRSRDPQHLSLRDFYARRIGRLAPLAIIVLLAGAVLYLTGGGGGGRALVVDGPGATFDGWFAISFPALSFNILRVARFSTAPGWGVWWDVFWSLAIEEQFYLLYPLLLRRFGTGRRMVAILLTVVVVGFGFAALATRMDADNVWLALLSSPPGFALLAMGCSLALAVEHRPIVLRRLPTVACIGGAGALILFAFRSADLNDGGLVLMWGPMLVGVGGLIAILGLLQLPNDNRWLAALAMPGELSYGMYLLHGAVLLLLWPVFPHLPPLLAFVTFAGSVVIVAYASHRGFERPVNRLIRARLRPWVERSKSTHVAATLSEA